MPEEGNRKPAKENTFRRILQMKNDSFTIAVLGLGLIGGSLAYALHGFRPNMVIIGYDIDPETTALALAHKAVSRVAPSPEAAVQEADLTIFCSSPSSIFDNLGKCLPRCKNGSVVTEVCGVKQAISAFITEHLPPGVDYIGLHPMAGKEVGGFVNAEAALFQNTGFILIIPENCRPASVALLEELSHYVGAGRVVRNGAAEHDAIIAYTSDLMHIAATMLCADYPANMTMAHTAGAFRDCTRIAQIDAALWRELLLDNADNILPPLEQYIQNLSALREALAANDGEALQALLQRAHDHKVTMKTL
jgi:prephenate dehydrogenase